MRHAPFTLLAGSLALTVVACSPTDEAATAGSFTAAKASAAELDKPLLVDFYATW